MYVCNVLCVRTYVSNVCLCICMQCIYVCNVFYVFKVLYACNYVSNVCLYIFIQCILCI